MAKIFLSYRRSDSHWAAHEIFERLKAIARKSKDQVFIDVESIKPGEDFVKSIERNVTGCDVLIAVIGPNWIDARGENGKRRLDDSKDIVRAEIAAALAAGVTVVPVLLDGARFPAENELPKDMRALATRNGIDVRKAHFDDDIARLALASGLDAKRVKAVTNKETQRKPRQFWHSRPPLFFTWHKTFLIALLPLIVIIGSRGILGENADQNDLVEMIFAGSLYLSGFFVGVRLFVTVLHFLFYIVRVIFRPRQPA